jgi:hypothetical protein
MTKPDFVDRPPNTEELTDYDRQHFKLYLRLLDTEADDVDWRKAAISLFGIDPVREPERARQIYEEHLARARWMALTGYRQLT